jgi:excisionase family DNA binding protein
MENVIIAKVTDLEDIINSTVKKAVEESKSESSKRDQDFLNIVEAAEFLNLAQQTIYGLTSKREIPFFKRGKKLYFRESELVAWLEQGRRKTKTEMVNTPYGFGFKKKGGRNV